MRRKTLDIVFSAGGLVLAGLLLVLGLVLQNQANFAKDYVHDQLAAQRIKFTPATGLDETEKKVACLVDNAGKELVTGKQAECYANEYIAYHLTETNNGKTYSETSNEQRALEKKIDALPPNSPDQAALDAQNAEIQEKVQTLFRGETLRGLLLTTYGFSIFGERAQQAALVCFLVASVLFLASVAGFVHAFTRGKDEIVT